MVFIRSYYHCLHFRFCIQNLYLTIKRLIAHIEFTILNTRVRSVIKDRLKCTLIGELWKKQLRHICHNWRNALRYVVYVLSILLRQNRKSIFRADANIASRWLRPTTLWFRVWKICRHKVIFTFAWQQHLLMTVRKLMQNLHYLLLFQTFWLGL